MNFSVYSDSGAEIHGYFIPDGFSSAPVINVTINGEEKRTEIKTWVFIEGALRNGAHQTGNVGFVLSEANVPGISQALQLEISDPESGLIFYRRAQPGQFLGKKVLRVETAYVPHSEIDLSLKRQFQFFEYRVEQYGFETIRQMLEIIHQPSVYVSGRILLKNFRLYIDYNIDIDIISLQDPFYELATRIIVFSREKKQQFGFVSPRDRILYKPIIDWLDGLNIQDGDAVTSLIKRTPKDAFNLLSSPFTQQLVASTPSDLVKLDDVSQALDVLSQFSLFDSGRDPATYPRKIEEVLGLAEGSIQLKPQLEAVHRLADVLRGIGRIEHLLEADLVLYHFIRKAEERSTK